MTFEHNEFPELTHEAKCVLMNTMKGIDVSKPCWDRRFAASVIREAVRQAGIFTAKTVLNNGEVVEVVTLSRIADSLHALPPEPPLKKQALDIWGEFEGEATDCQARIMRTALAMIPDPTA